MTDVIIAPRAEDPLSDTEAVITGGWYQIRPSAAYVSGGQWVQPIWSPSRQFTGSSFTVKLDPLPGTPYELLAELPDGRGGKIVLHEFRIVPSSGTPVTWETCVQVSGPAGGAVPTDVVDARLDALEAGIGGVSGGASNLAAITDMSAFMRTVNDDTSAAAARTTLGAADATATVNLTGAQTVAGVKTFSSSPIIPTPTTSTQAAPKSYVDSAVSGVVAGSVDWANVANKPSTFAPTLPIASSGVTGFSTLEGRVTTLEGQTTESPQILTWIDTTSKYGTLDAAKTYHYFYGEVDPRVAGYAVTTSDRWFKQIPATGVDNPNFVKVGSNTRALNGTNIDRGIDQIIRYTRSETQTVTPTNQFGVEITVSLTTDLVTAVNNRVASGSTTGTTIPAGSYVLSGHGVGTGLAGTFLLTNGTVGAAVDLITDNTVPTPDPGTEEPDLPTGSGSKIMGLYKNMFQASPDMRDWPTDIKDYTNMVYLAISQSASAGSGQLTFPYASMGQTAAQFQADIAEFKGRGCNVLLAIGGSSDGGVTITNDATADQAFASIASIRATFGITGLDIDLEPSGSTWNNAGLGRLVTRCKTEFGAGFIVGCTVGLYGTNTARWQSFYQAYPAYIDYIAPMCYDFVEAKTSALTAVVLDKANTIASWGAPDSKIVIGFMMQPPGQTSYNASPTAAIVYNAWNAAKAARPNIGGAFFWVDNELAGRSWDGFRGLAPFVRPEV